jgi:hypothetical protein
VSKWDFKKAEIELTQSFDSNDEKKLLKVLKNNSYLFYELFPRKYGIQPVFSEISFGDTYRCDYAWLNDNSDGPEWILVEVEKPRMKLFTKKNEATAVLNHAIGQLESWERYFEQNPGEKSRIFGAVARFKFVLVAGSKEDWNNDKSRLWRVHRLRSNKYFEIKSSDVFMRALKVAKDNPQELWSFEKHPIALCHSQLKNYWESYPYMDHWRKILK